MSDSSFARLSRWNAMIEGLDASPKEFFSAVEEAIKKRTVPDTKISHEQWKEGGVLSAKRECLVVRRKDLTFDICAAPFGNGFFVSWWLSGYPGFFRDLISRIPVIGKLFHHAFTPSSYYQIDTAIMFQTLIHSAVKEVVDQMTKTKGLRTPSELEYKPIMRDFFA